jgi:hypothetical protein
MKKKRMLFLMWLAAAWPAWAQGILPPDGFAPGWKKGEALRTFTGPDLFNHIDGGADLFLEFGFARLFVQAYSNGTSELTAAVYVMESATAALGVYLLKMGRESPFPEVPARNSCEDSQLTIVKGRHFIQIDNFDATPAPRAVSTALARAVLARLADEKPESVLDRLAPENRIPGSERLIRGPVALQPYYTFGEGDILGLNGVTFGALADYRASDGSTFTRFIVPYSTPAAAKAVLENLRANLDPYLKITADRPAGFDFLDFQKKHGRVELRSELLEIRFKLADLREPSSSSKGRSCENRPQRFPAEQVRHI